MGEVREVGFFFGICQWNSKQTMEIMFDITPLSFDHPPSEFGPKSELCREFEAVMKSKFEMSVMGELSFFLGLQASQEKTGMYVHQTKYVHEILKRFGLEDSLSYDTPLPKNHKLSPDKEKDPEVSINSEGVSLESSQAYLQISERPEGGLDLMAYADADFGGCPMNRKSTSGGAQLLGNRLVSWQCKNQVAVSLSTCEVEYIAALSCCAQFLLFALFETASVQVSKFRVFTNSQLRVFECLKVPSFL
ncbi:uncharacterized mitochondrial protein AtMg00810-like [Helianthus annuus]|uniref:uncharacterized mitochondrial protein AtMg00810-like n=1 Tax=Helianthus annuus TaxID=4232 RepID=UPI00165339A1|nr:uncharacterized mitochondrial protein AtMg00810-like [Helianthus annuus]